MGAAGGARRRGGYIKEKRGEAEVGGLGRRRKVRCGLRVRVVEGPEPWMGVGALGIGPRCAWEGRGMEGSLEHIERGHDVSIGGHGA